METIILAGGLGTRLKDVVGDLPKPMAPVAGRPFLQLLLDFLAEQGTKRAILAVSYRWQVIKDHFGERYNGIELDYSVEDEPLGTGGGIKKALKLCKGPAVMVMNGDTFFRMNIKDLFSFQKETAADMVVALKHVDNCGRYGRVILGDNNRVERFEEKSTDAPGYINTGIFVLQRDIFDKASLPEKFSFERDLLEKEIDNLKAYGMAFDGDFVDIGIKEDYLNAESFLFPPLKKGGEGGFF